MDLLEQPVKEGALRDCSKEEGLEARRLIHVSLVVGFCVRFADLDNGRAEVDVEEGEVLRARAPRPRLTKGFVLICRSHPKSSVSSAFFSTSMPRSRAAPKNSSSASSKYQSYIGYYLYFQIVLRPAKSID